MVFLRTVLISLCLMLSAATANASEFWMSHYTSLMDDSCKQNTQSPSEGVTYCRGLVNTRFRLTEEASTMRLELLDSRGGSHALHTPHTISIGDIAEWYGTLVRGKLRPEMLIVRMIEKAKSVDQEPQSNLVLVRLDAGNTCTVARVAPIENQNQIAREMARSMHNAPCLKEVASN